MDKQIAQVGCLKIGHRVFAGNGSTIWEIEGFSFCKITGTTLAAVRGGKRKKVEQFNVSRLSLAGPNGKGEGY